MLLDNPFNLLPCFETTRGISVKCTFRKFFIIRKHTKTNFFTITPLDKNNNTDNDVTASKRWETNLDHQHFHRNHTNITRQLQYSDEITPYIGISEGGRVIGDALWDDSTGDFTLDGISHHMPLKTIYELEKFRVDMMNLTGGHGGQWTFVGCLLDFSRCLLFIMNVIKTCFKRYDMNVSNAPLIQNLSNV